MKFVICQVGTKYAIRLDIGSLKLKDKQKLEPYLVFNCDTYNNIKKYESEPEAVDHIFSVVNWCFDKLNNEQRIKFAEFYASASYGIKNTMPKTNIGILKFTEELGEQYLQLAKEMNLLEIFREYTKQEIAMQDASLFGTRPQDTAEMTFKEDEMRETTVVACFCKMMAPIFGEIINNLPEQQMEDGKKRLPKYKESRCVGLLTAINSEFFPDLISKLEHYVFRIVSNLCGKNKDPSPVFDGLTINTRTSIIMSSLFVRNYVTCKLERKDSNIIRFTDTIVRTLAMTQDSGAHKAQVKTRRAPGAMISGDESGNTAQMEVDSLVSNGTMDGPILVEAAVDDAIRSHRQTIGITRGEFQECLDYFKGNPIYQTPLNIFAACAVFGREIGGGRGIEMIGSESYTKLIAMLQLIAFNLGYVQLGNFLTAAKSTNVKVKIGAEEDIFKRQAPTLSNYRECRGRFARSMIAIGDQEWDKQMNIILEDLTNNIYLTNTPDYILDQVPENSTEPLSSFIHNGETLHPTVDLSEQLCGMIKLFNKDVHESDQESNF